MFIVKPSIYYEKRCANAHSIFGALREFYEAAGKPPINMSVGLLDIEEHELLLVRNGESLLLEQVAAFESS